MMVYLDTNCVIYFVERNPAWVPKVIARLTRFRAANHRLAVGDLTWAECLVGPFTSGDAAVEASYRAFFTDPDIQVLPMTAAICERAARIRAAHKFEPAGLRDRLPDGDRDPRRADVLDVAEFARRPAGVRAVRLRGGGGGRDYE